MFKALKLAHLLLHSQREVEMIAGVAQAAAEDISALRTDLSARPTTQEIESMIAEAIAAHNGSAESHPDCIAVRKG